MDLITPKQLVEANKYMQYFGGETLAKLLFRILKFNKLNKEYGEICHLPAQEFIGQVMEKVEFGFQVDDNELENIPKTGPFITISNHAYGGIDGLILLKIIPSVRPDFMVLVNFLLTQVDPLKEYFLGVNPFEAYKNVKSSFGGLKDAFIHLQEDHPIGIFPAGEVSSVKLQYRGVADKEWKYSILKFIKRSKVTVIPVYFDGSNSSIFHFLGLIHPTLRTIKLPSELFNKKGKIIPVRIGTPILVKEQNEFEDIRDFGRFLRMKTYALGIPLANKKRQAAVAPSGAAQEPVIDPVPQDHLLQEIDSIREEYTLFRIQNQSVFCVPTVKIPYLATEIGRLREITYRLVGEGTNRSFDLDHYDQYFEQLFIWDEEENRIVGGYRIGKGKAILKNIGIGGFYISTLFQIDPDFSTVLAVSIELGRSFIVQEYQKKTMSLFMLWKGILYLLIKNPEYRYLIGPVSMSNEFLDVSKALAVEFLRAHYYNSEFAEYIHPNKPFTIQIPRKINKELYLKYVGKDLNRLDRFINSIDPLYKTPVLFKKYLSVNAEIIGFNIDPQFNNCLDALTILDLYEVPYDMIENLSKEINDHSILDRFRK
ncbi:MAG: lysophospholipid acyltransferase family protein [Bacteroidetes bacterium]|nr:lysophospholipid acyltransferase family protein [Bacteroidota bacterium]